MKNDPGLFSFFEEGFPPVPFLEADMLPAEVQALPKEAQEIWLSVFNSTFRTFSGTDDEKEEASFVAAWGAVKSRFARGADGKWMRKAQLSFEDTSYLKSQFMRFVKFSPNLMEAKRRITLGEVYVPWEVDSHGDFADPETIEEGAYRFMEKQQIGEQHKLFGGKGIVVEHFISRAGDRDFPVPGSMILGTQWSEDMWEKILNGEVNGYSLAGKGLSVPIVAAQDQVKNIVLAKSGEMIGEIDPELFEEPKHDGPRQISQIIKLDIGEVSGVTTPANRKHFKLFKGETMTPKVHVVAAKAEGDVAPPAPTETDPKQVPGSPWLKLYNQLIKEGYTPEEARRLTEEVLGPAPPGTVTVEEQSESLGVLKSLKSAISAIAKKLGVNGAEEGEDSPMTPQEKERFDALEKSVGDMKGTLDTIAKAIAPAPAAQEVAVQKCNCGGAAPVALKVEEKAGESVKEENAIPPVDLGQLNTDVLEIAKAVMELTKRFDEFQSSPGVSGVEKVLIPEAGDVPIQKSAGSSGWESSSILGAPLPAGARKAVTEEAIKRQERRNQRLQKHSNINLRMS